jgi:hypothetical protein
VAVTAVPLEVTVAFQEFTMAWLPDQVQVTFQVLVATVPVLLTVTLALKPLPQLLLMEYAAVQVALPEPRVGLAVRTAVADALALRTAVELALALRTAVGLALALRTAVGDALALRTAVGLALALRTAVGVGLAVRTAVGLALALRTGVGLALAPIAGLAF